MPKKATAKKTAKTTPKPVDNTTAIAATKPATQPKSEADVKPATPRRLKTGNYNSFRLQKRIKPPADQATLPGGLKLFRGVLRLVWQNRKMFGAMLAVYALVSLALVRSFNIDVNVQDLRNNVSGLFSGQGAQLFTSAALFTQLIGTSGSASDGNTSAGGYQVITVLVMSLAVIWAFRQLSVGEKFRMRDTFYKGMTPLVPFMLVLFAIGVQTLPAVFGVGLYNMVTLNGVASTDIEKVIWAVVMFLGLLLTLYMVASSIFALYIVTLPDMTPLRALRSARGLVRYRRWLIMRRLLVLPVILLVLAALILIPILMFSTTLAVGLLFLIGVVGVLLVHGYLYALYRELL